MSGRVLRVSAIDASGRLRLTAELTCEGGYTHRCYRLAEQTYDRLGAPQAGQLLDDEQLAMLAEAEGDCCAEAVAERLLAYGDNSARALCRKLRQRGYAGQASENAVARMMQKGYLKEDEQAYRLVVQAATKKLWGPRRILAALAAKGYDGAVIRAAIKRAEAEGDIDFAASGAELLHRKFGDEQPSSQERRSLLYRYGY